MTVPVGGAVSGRGDDMDSNEVADVLRKAVDVLAERGWTQGETEDNAGRVCAYGAIREAAMLAGVPVHPACQRFFKSLDWEQPAGDAWIGIWNDQPERTYEDVVLALKHAAVDVEADTL